MADRKAELERKKARLQQMREEKERRRKEKERIDAESAAQSLIVSRAASSSPSRSCKYFINKILLKFSRCYSLS
jgi:hypothetical protein